MTPAISQAHHDQAGRALTAIYALLIEKAEARRRALAAAETGQKQAETAVSGGGLVQHGQSN